MTSKLADAPATYSSIEQVYGNDSSAATERFVGIRSKFVAHYGHEPTFFARAPGRVNVIGEHIDYCGYAVFPLALEQDIVIAASPNNRGKYCMANTNHNFSSFETDAKDFLIDGKSWYHYVLCGHKGVLDAVSLENPLGMNILVDGVVPKSAGLSSSSALVCCSGLTTAHMNGKTLGKYELAEICTKCERYIGTEGGGMDQSISFLADKGSAKLIEFNPLKATNVMLPDGAVFVIANSLREMTKSQDAGAYFNLRVAECRLAAQLLSKLGGFEWRSTRRLVDTQQAYGKSLEDMVDLVGQLLHQHPYTREELCQELGVSDDEFVTQCLSESTKHATTFKLYHRAKHVYSEAARVWKFKEVCEEHADNALQVLGRLMNESQESCSRDYECSCEELDELTDICRMAGALGSRLTGAGWGGCTVSLVPRAKLEVFMGEVKAKYYACDSVRAAKVDEALFATKPGSGAAIITA